MKTQSRLKVLLVLMIAMFVVGACAQATAVPPAAQPTQPAVAQPTEDMSPCAPASSGTYAGVDPRNVTFEFWHNHSSSREAGLMEMIAEFNSTNECGITVEATNQGSYNDIRDKMNAGIATGEVPGLVVGYQNDQAFYQLSNALVDLRPYMDDPKWGFSAAEKADFFQSFLDAAKHPAYDNQQLGFPPNRSMEVIYYNETWLKELGFDGNPPTTPADFREMACTAAEANGDGTGGYILRSDASAVAAWTFAFGGDVLTPDGQSYQYNAPETVEAMTFIKGLVDDGCAYFFTEGFPNPEFAARRAIFTQGSSSGIPFYKTDVETVAGQLGRDPDVWGVAAIPHTTPDPVMNIYGGDVMIPATNPQTQLATWIFVKWYTSPEIQARWTTVSNYFPVRASSEGLLGDVLGNNPQFNQAVQLLKYGAFEPQLISYQGTRDAAEAAFNEMMQGADIQETLDKLTADANALQAELSK